MFFVVPELLFQQNSSFTVLVYMLLLISGLAQYLNVFFSNPGTVVIKTVAGSDEEGLLKRSDLEAVEAPELGSPKGDQLEKKSLAKTFWNYCDVCEAWRAPRSRHCTICSKCVVKFDHHCPFFDNCIGGKNHRYFWWFLFTVVMVLCWTIYIFCDLLWFTSFEESPIATVYLIFGIFMLCCVTLSVGCMLGFHSWLAITNKTTYENIMKWRAQHQHRHGRNNDANAPIACDYSEGICYNIYQFCFAKLRTEWLYSAPLDEA